MTLLGHDIRSAMSDVLGGLRLIDVSRLPDDIRGHFGRVRAAGDTLARLLDEALLEWSDEPPLASNAGSQELALIDTLGDIEQRWAGHAREHGLHLTVSVSDQLPTVIGVNPVALERILSNLLSNAIKYAGKGQINLLTSVTAENELNFQVQDQGPGFDPSALEGLFRFRHRGSSTARPGSGLGLHICKDLSDQIGGRLSVENGRTGARVTLTLPQKAWELKTDSERTDPLPNLAGKRVLVAEDNATNQLLVGQMLTQMGATFMLAESGLAALRLYQQHEFDLALIDIEMPEMTGLDLMQEIRATPGDKSRLPILALTAYVLRSNREAIYEAGADSILAKPLSSLESFGFALRDVLLRATGKPSVEKSPVRASTAESENFDHLTLQHLLGIAGPESGSELLSRLISDLGAVQRNLGDGIKNGDTASVRAKTHVLISLAGAIGAHRLQYLAETMNTAVHQRDIGVISDIGPEALERLEELIVELRTIRNEKVRRTASEPLP
jgi:two-component system aerobic respiration control sensor histidine kinase ArcB